VKQDIFHCNVASLSKVCTVTTMASVHSFRKAQSTSIDHVEKVINIHLSMLKN